MLRTLTAFAVLLAVAGVTLALSWSSPPFHDGDDHLTGQYVNTTEGFSVVIPEGWTGHENDTNLPLLSIDASQTVFLAAGELWIFPLESDATAEEWLEGRIARLGIDDIRSSGPVVYAGADSGHRTLMAYAQQNGTVIVDFWTGGRPWFAGFPAPRPDHGGPVAPTSGRKATAFADSFALQEPMPFGASPKDSLFQYWGEIITIDPALSPPRRGRHCGAQSSAAWSSWTTTWKSSPTSPKGGRCRRTGPSTHSRCEENARFHDGRPVSALDVKYSWERALHPETASPVAKTYLGDVAGAAALAAGEAVDLEGVQALDDRTLQVTITGPFPYFLAKLTYPTSFVVDRANVESGENWTDDPIGTGAFKLKVWQEDQLLVLERNEGWYGGTPKLAHAVYRIFAGRPIQMYEQGEIDLTGVGTYDIDRVQDPSNSLNAHLREGTNLCTYYLGFNASQPPFDDPKVREALALGYGNGTSGWRSP